MKVLGIISVMGIASMAGCDSYQPNVNDARLDKGLVIVLTGVEGRSVFNEVIGAGLAEGGVDWAIEIDDWTSLLGPFASLRDLERSRQQADRVAQRIVRYQQQQPGRPVVLVGQSGGAGLAPWIAEALPDGAMVEGLILIAPALSPGYPLGEALAKSRRGIVSYHSPMDWVILGIGTSVFGTLDGEHVDSAGKVGFDVPTGEQAQAYDMLYQFPWSPDMAREGRDGPPARCKSSRVSMSRPVMSPETTRPSSLTSSTTTQRVAPVSIPKTCSPGALQVPRWTSRRAVRRYSGTATTFQRLSASVTLTCTGESAGR